MGGSPIGRSPQWGSVYLFVPARQLPKPSRLCSHPIGLPVPLFLVNKQAPELPFGRGRGARGPGWLQKPKNLSFRRNYGRPYRVSNAESNFSICHSLGNSKLSTEQLATGKHMKQTRSFYKFRLPEKVKIAAHLHGGFPHWRIPSTKATNSETESH